MKKLQGFPPEVQIAESTHLTLSHHSNWTKLRLPWSIGCVKKCDIFLLVPITICFLGNFVKTFLWHWSVNFYVVIFLHWLNLLWKYLMEDKGTSLGSEGFWRTTSSLWVFFHCLHLFSASESSSSVGCVSSPSLLAALALLHRESFHIFSILWEFALRQALLQCLCTNQGTSVLKHQ